MNEPTKTSRARQLLRRYGLSIALVLVAGTIALMAWVVARNSDNTRQLAMERSQLAATQERIAATQRTFEISQKASTETRVQTVTQRCDLTRLILRVLVRVHDSVDAAPFQTSEATCLVQLASVKRINAHTPSVK